jgi:hypothetical protein
VDGWRRCPNDHGLINEDTRMWRKFWVKENHCTVDKFLDAWMNDERTYMKGIWEVCLHEGGQPIFLASSKLSSPQMSWQASYKTLPDITRNNVNSHQREHYPVLPAYRKTESKTFLNETKELASCSTQLSPYLRRTVNRSQNLTCYCGVRSAAHVWNKKLQMNSLPSAFPYT